MSASESTAASTLVHYRKKEIPEDLEDNIWAESREGNRETHKELFVGQEAFLSYYRKFRKVSQDPDRFKSSPSVAFIKETNRLMVPPSPFGLIKRKGLADEINVRHYNIGNNYGRALGNSMKYIKPKSIMLGCNKNTKGISCIVENLNDGLEKLDLSDNLISVKSIIDLCSWMSLKSIGSKLKLKYLNLSGNKLGDD